MGNILLIHSVKSLADRYRKMQIFLSWFQYKANGSFGKLFFPPHLSITYLLLKDMESFPCLHSTQQRQLMISQRIMSLLQNLLTHFDVKGIVLTSYSRFQEAFKVTTSHRGMSVQETVNSITSSLEFAYLGRCFFSLLSIHPYLDLLLLCCS